MYLWIRAIGKVTWKQEMDYVMGYIQYQKKWAM